jgi:UDP-glucose 4-epimerase
LLAYVSSCFYQLITQTAAGNREELRIFGNDYNTPDGTAIQDYIHGVDLAKAQVVAIRRIRWKE